MREHVTSLTQTPVSKVKESLNHCREKRGFRNPRTERRATEQVAARLRRTLKVVTHRPGFEAWKAERFSDGSAFLAALTQIIAQCVYLYPQHVWRPGRNP
jgi:hypothetical protein